MAQELIDLLRSEVDAVLYKVSEAENMASAVREDLSPEIATLEDNVERYPRRSCFFLRPWPGCASKPHPKAERTIVDGADG